MLFVGKWGVKSALFLNFRSWGEFLSVIITSFPIRFHFLVFMLFVCNSCLFTRGLVSEADFFNGFQPSVYFCDIFLSSNAVLHEVLSEFLFKIKKSLSL